MPMLETRIRDLAHRREWSRLYIVNNFPPPPDKYNTTHREYKYEMPGPSPQLHDRVLGTMINIMRVHCRANMLFAASKIRIFNLDDSPPLAPSQPTAIKSYAFKQWGEEFPFAVDITLQGSPLLSENTILIRYKEKPRYQHQKPWMTFRKFLDSFPIPHHMIHNVDYKLQIRFQQTWWSRNGKCFPLMDEALPAEVRSIIYRHVLGENVYPAVDGTSKVTFGSMSANLSWGDINSPERFDEDDIMKRSDFPNYNILYVNSRVTHKALKTAWEAGYKHFVKPHLFESALASIRPPAYNWLNRIHLNFDLSDFFMFFGIHIDPIVRIDQSQSVRTLFEGLPARGLKHLELYFRDPYRYPEYTYASDNSSVYIHGSPNPWNAFFEDAHANNDPPADDIRHMERYPCQKTALDWLLTAALPLIKDVPHIHLAGAVKTSTQAKWYSIFKRARGVANLDDLAPYFDYEQELAAFVGQPAYA
jgi:hypothetical protein